MAVSPGKRSGIRGTTRLIFTICENGVVPQIQKTRRFLLFNEGYGSRLVWVEDFIGSAPDTILVMGCSGAVAVLDRLLRACRTADPNCVIINVNPHEDGLQSFKGSGGYLPMTASSFMAAVDLSRA